MNEGKERQVKRVPRWMQILLVVSLALNVLIVGAIGGAVLSKEKWHHHGPHAKGGGGPLTRALSPEDRRSIGRQMHAALRDLGETREERRVEFQGLLSDLRSEPFDAEPVRQRMDRLHSGFAEKFQLGQQLLLERLEVMTPEARAAYADRLEEVLRHRH